MVARGQSRRVTRRVTFRMRCDHNPPHARVVLQNLKIQTSTDVKPNNSQPHRPSDVSNKPHLTNTTGSNMPAVTSQPQTFSATLNKGQECKSKQGLLMERLSSTFHWRNACMEDAYRNHRSAGTVHMGESTPCPQLITHADQLGHPRFKGEVSDDSRKLFFTKNAFTAGKNCLDLPGNLCSWFKQ